MSKKRKKGSGTLRKRTDGRWEARVVIGYDENGKPLDIGFEDIHERWKGMTYEEICKEINEIEEE